MRRLLIGFILLFALGVQAQERRIEDWMVWIYVPEDETLLFRGFYAEQDETVSFIPTIFERRLQQIDRIRNIPSNVSVSYDAATIAYVINTVSEFSNESNSAAGFPNIVLTEILSQGVLSHEVRTFESTSISLAFHITDEIQALGRTLYHNQQRLPALAFNYPDRERILAYAYRDIREVWRIEVYDFNAERVLNQFDLNTIPELDAEQVIIHRYQDDDILFSTITDGTETLYEWSLANSTLSEASPILFWTETTDYSLTSNEALAIEDNSLLYYRNPNVRGTSIFEGESGQSLSYPRFVQGGDTIAFVLDDTISLIDREGNSILSSIPAAKLTQLVSTPTGLIYVLENEAFSEVNYVHTMNDSLFGERFVVWGNYTGPTPVEVINVHTAQE